MIDGSMQVELEIDPAQLQQAQKYLDMAVVRYCEPYVPFRTGTLARSPYQATNFGSGEVVYSTPYARYQYYGEIMSPSFPIEQAGVIVGYWSRAPKKLTGRPLNYNTEVHPLAGSHWFERMKADKLTELTEELERYVNRTNNNG